MCQCVRLCVIMLIWMLYISSYHGHRHDIGNSKIGTIARRSYAVDLITLWHNSHTNTYTLTLSHTHICSELIKQMEYKLTMIGRLTEIYNHNQDPLWAGKWERKRERNGGRESVRERAKWHLSKIK